MDRNCRATGLEERSSLAAAVGADARGASTALGAPSAACFMASGLGAAGCCSGPPLPMCTGPTLHHGLVHGPPQHAQQSQRAATARRSSKTSKAVNSVVVRMKSTNTTRPAQMQNQRTPGKSTRDATKKAKRLVNEVKKMADPARPSAAGTRASTGMDGSSARRKPTRTMASSTPTPTTMKTIMRLRSVRGTPKAAASPKPAISAKRMVTTAPTPRRRREWAGGNPRPRRMDM
mmetsp:Transcript_12667/g.38140  ORF Transcript_12667/g.38140 Transcript_12667/m.38140 type:complete len:233 (+) Transcript_12667:1459-2157(+)